MSELATRLNFVRNSIAKECEKLARPEPTLIVVTKNHSVELNRELLQLGVSDFGENRVQEALPKAQELSSETINWHLIGQLQTNKVKQALEFATILHSLDRVALLTELAKRTIDRENPLPVFVQVNLTQDEARGGVSKEDLLGFAEKVSNVSSLQLLGLMAVASLDQPAESDFETMAILSQKLKAQFPEAKALSIGMSDDYLPALSFGATHLRIGTAITGKRTY